MRSRTSNPLFLALLLAVCMSLSGCASLLERSYSVVEPYTDRYRDSGGEDALRAESYQDLVNSLMMLVEQRAEEGTIRCYEEANSYILARRARQEVRQDTTLGAYLLDGLNFTYEGEEGYCTLTCHMSYREDAEDLGSVMTISDSQSLVDLLRLAVREELEKLTVRFVNDTSQTDVTAAIDALWQELCRGEEKTEPPLDEALSQTPEVPETDAQPPLGEDAASLEDASLDDASTEEGISANASLFSEEGTDLDSVEPEEPPEPEYPPCPWRVRFYPHMEAAKIVEILLGSS